LVAVLEFENRILRGNVFKKERVAFDHIGFDGGGDERKVLGGSEMQKLKFFVVSDWLAFVPFEVLNLFFELEMELVFLKVLSKEKPLPF
jgi:hypothetical protein